jgi:hypothetical protein
LAEVEDHLLESRDIEAFGEPRLVAQRFADELATAATRKVAVGAFLALVPAGIAYLLLFLFAGRYPDITSARFLPLGLAAALTMLLAPQFALATGVAALLRAWRLRHARVVPVEEVRVLRRRAAVAVGSGALALGGVALYAYEYSAGLSSFWIFSALSVSTVTLLPLAPAAVAIRRVSLLRPATPGVAGDLCYDLAPLLDRLPPALTATPWRVCLAVAGVVALAAVIAAGPDEGLRNAAVEAAAICAGFGTLGRFLGLRR